jgi:hypothetical protein
MILISLHFKTIHMRRKVYQIHIALRLITPRIWRRLLIPANMLLSDFHKIIQTTMGWTNSHLHEFIKNKIPYTVQYVHDDLWKEAGCVDYKKMKVSDLLKVENDKILYLYDLGDYWEHYIKLEKIMPFDKNMMYPTCLDGRNNCPPEDCGGVNGYADFVSILKDPTHDEYEDYLSWVGGEFDPAYFDKDMVNVLLRTKEYGCADIF